MIQTSSGVFLNQKWYNLSPIRHVFHKMLVYHLHFVVVLTKFWEIYLSDLPLNSQWSLHNCQGEKKVLNADPSEQNNRVCDNFVFSIAHILNKQWVLNCLSRSKENVWTVFKVTVSRHILNIFATNPLSQQFRHTFFVCKFYKSCRFFAPYCKRCFKVCQSY